MHDWAEFRHFKYLLAVLELQGFRAAAEELHTAQPNLSIQARQFQENASLHLYRTGKGNRLRLTPTGVAFKAIARGLLDARDEAIEALLAVERGDIQAVNFGCGSLADPGLFQTFCDMHKEILPDCPIRLTHGDVAQLVEEIVEGVVDAAIVTLPLGNPSLRIEELRRDRLVVCLRKDNPLASKASLQPVDLQGNLNILYHPQRHPQAHERLLELLEIAGVQVEEYSRASHPTEMQMLVKAGYGFALVREGSDLDSDLTVRPIAGVDWTIDTAVVFHKQRHPKTIPVLIRRLRSQLTGSSSVAKKPVRPVRNRSEQMSLLG
jgi:DNA-binding transcriptional LysR family regulator